MQKLTKRFSRGILVLVAMLSFALPLSVPAFVYAAEDDPGTLDQGSTPDIQGGLCEGANLQVNSTEGCDEGDADTAINDTITLVINIFSLVVGVIAVIMIIVGGLKYITSGGDSGNVTGAKNTILYAVVGLVVVALAQFIVRFVLARANPES